MEKTNLISIIMSVYNSEKYLAESIDSLLSQTYKNFELIVIDDLSTDNSKSIAQEFSKRDSRVIVIENKYDKGIHGASNSGLDIARGQFIAKADADDLQRPYRLKDEIEFLNDHPDIDIVGGGYQLFGEINNVKVFHPSDSLVLAWRFISDIYFCNPTVMFRRSVLYTIPHYPKVVCEDFSFLSKALKKHQGYNIKKILIDYRQHDTNYSKTKEDNIKISAKEIFEENFMFYTGSLEYSNEFYNFHSKHDLAIKDTQKIIKKSAQIVRRIAHQYDSKNIFLKHCYLSMVILKDIAIAILRHYLYKTYKKYHG